MRMNLFGAWITDKPAILLRFSIRGYENMYDYGIPNCVPEYFREKFEREEHEAELHEKRKEHYNANKEKLKKHMKLNFPFYPMEVMMNANPARMQTTIPRQMTMTISAT